MFVFQVVKRKYQQEPGIAVPITFDGDRIALDIPGDGVQTDNGWEIIPLNYPCVSSRTYSYKVHILTDTFIGYKCRCNVKMHLIYIVGSHQVEVLVNLVPHAQSVAEALPRDAYFYNCSCRSRRKYVHMQITSLCNA